MESVSSSVVLLKTQFNFYCCSEKFILVYFYILYENCKVLYRKPTKAKLSSVISHLLRVRPCVFCCSIQSCACEKWGLTLEVRAIEYSNGFDYFRSLSKAFKILLVTKLFTYTSFNSEMNGSDRLG